MQAWAGVQSRHYAQTGNADHQDLRVRLPLSPLTVSLISRTMCAAKNGTANVTAMLSARLSEDTGPHVSKHPR